MTATSETVETQPGARCVTTEPHDEHPVAGSPGGRCPGVSGPNDCTCWATSRQGCPVHAVDEGEAR